MQPLENIQVLDLTHVLAGPFCAYQLAVLGADVVKIESPDEPDMMRDDGPGDPLSAAGLSARFMAQASNKRAITLNLKTEDGRDIFKRMLQTADVVIENFRCGAMDALGLGYEALSALKPDLVYCSLTGYGHSGDKARHPAFDNVIQAFSGLMSASGTEAVQPVKVGVPVLDYGTGAQAALAVTAALLRRERTGQGEHIDVSMTDAALMLMSSTVVETHISGDPPRPFGNNNRLIAAYCCYATADGLLMLGAHTKQQLVNLWRALGDSDRAAEINSQPWHEGLEQYEEDAARLEAILKTRNGEEWETLLNAARVPAARVRKLDEVIAHPQVAERGVLQQVEHPAHPGETLKVPVAAFGYASGDGPRATTPPARFGEHTDEVLAELGLSAQEIAGLRERGVV